MNTHKDFSAAHDIFRSAV